MGESTVGLPTRGEPPSGGFRSVARRIGELDEIGVLGALIVLVVLLALLVPVAPFVSPLILASAATLVLILVPVWEWRSLRHTADVPPPSDTLERE